jgi:hypothetical protein
MKSPELPPLFQASNSCSLHFALHSSLNVAKNERLPSTFSSESLALPLDSFAADDRISKQYFS